MLSYITENHHNSHNKEFSINVYASLKDWETKSASVAPLLSWVRCWLVRCHLWWKWRCICWQNFFKFFSHTINTHRCLLPLFILRILGGFVVNLHFRLILILSGAVHLFGNGLLPYIQIHMILPRPNNTLLCEDTTSAPGQEEIPLILYLYLCICICVFVVVYFYKDASAKQHGHYIPANIGIWQGAIAEDLWPQRSLWNLTQRYIALHKPCSCGFLCLCIFCICVCMFLSNWTLQ